MFRKVLLTSILALGYFSSASAQIAPAPTRPATGGIGDKSLNAIGKPTQQQQPNEVFGNGHTPGIPSTGTSGSPKIVTNNGAGKATGSSIGKEYQEAQAALIDQLVHDVKDLQARIDKLEAAQKK
jgi:hypothetical protein